MNADELKQLGEQCLELARAIPGDRAPFTYREAWWKKVRALRVGPLHLDRLPASAQIDPSERSELRDALQQIDHGKNIKNNEPDPGPCVTGLETAGALLQLVASRMPSPGAWSRDFKMGSSLPGSASTRWPASSRN